jgi:hypothetical protein
MDSMLVQACASTTRVRHTPLTRPGPVDPAAWQCNQQHPGAAGESSREGARCVRCAQQEDDTFTVPHILFYARVLALCSIW